MDFLEYFLLKIREYIAPKIFEMSVNEFFATSGTNSGGYATLICLIPIAYNSNGE
jgi:hypothetical protein